MLKKEEFDKVFEKLESIEFLFLGSLVKNK